jgi:hypothetical protein
MEFLKIVKRRSFINEFVYVVLNIGLAAALLALVKITGSIWPALVLVLLSKWRVFAVRSQFWFANIQANSVSAIVSVSYVVFLYTLNTMNISDWTIFGLQILLAVLDACWLLFLKPKSKRKYIVAQAAVAMFAGVTTIYILSYNWIASVAVLAIWLVGYSTARHVLNSYDDEDHVVLLSLIWGLVMAELGWLAYHWTIAYQLPIVNGVLLPQISIITLCMSVVAYKSYDSYYHNQKIRMSDILLPLIFTVGIIIVLVFAFNGVTANLS